MTSTVETRDITARLLCALMANGKFAVMTPSSSSPDLGAAAQELGEAFEKLHAKVATVAPLD